MGPAKREGAGRGRRRTAGGRAGSARRDLGLRCAEVSLNVTCRRLRDSESSCGRTGLLAALLAPETLRADGAGEEGEGDAGSGGGRTLPAGPSTVGAALLWLWRRPGTALSPLLALCESLGSLPPGPYLPGPHVSGHLLFPSSHSSPSAPNHLCLSLSLSQKLRPSTSESSLTPLRLLPPCRPAAGPAGSIFNPSPEAGPSHPFRGCTLGQATALSSWHYCI